MQHVNASEGIIFVEISVVLCIHPPPALKPPAPPGNVCSMLHVKHRVHCWHRYGMAIGTAQGQQQDLIGIQYLNGTRIDRCLNCKGIRLLHRQLWHVFCMQLFILLYIYTGFILSLDLFQRFSILIVGVELRLPFRAFCIDMHYSIHFLLYRPHCYF